jgi:hypothetical protein
METFNNTYKIISRISKSKQIETTNTIVILKPDDFDSAQFSCNLLFKLCEECEENIGMRALYTHYRKNNAYKLFKDRSNNSELKPIDSSSFVTTRDSFVTNAPIQRRSFITVERYCKNLWTRFNSRYFNVAIMDDADLANNNNFSDIFQTIRFGVWDRSGEYNNGVLVYIVNKRDQYKFWENSFIIDSELLVENLVFKEKPDSITLNRQANYFMFDLCK